MKLLEPYLFWIKLGALVVAIVGVFWFGHRTGASGVQAKWDAEKLAAEQEANATNRNILRNFENAQAASEKDKRNAKIATDKLRAAVNNGSLRLSVPVESCKANDPGAGDQQARADIVPASAGRIIDIAIEGDEAVRDLNQCIDKYNAVKESIGPLK